MGKDHLDACRRLAELEALTNGQLQQLAKCADAREHAKTEAENSNSSNTSICKDNALRVEQKADICNHSKLERQPRFPADSVEETSGNVAARLDSKLVHCEVLSGLVQNLGQNREPRQFMDMLL